VKAAQLIVKCLRNEGLDFAFDVAGVENLAADELPPALHAALNSRVPAVTDCPANAAKHLRWAHGTGELAVEPGF